MTRASRSKRSIDLLVEIDEDVATEDQIEHAEMREVRQQIELPVSDHGANVRRELPHIARPRWRAAAAPP